MKAKESVSYFVIAMAILLEIFSDYSEKFDFFLIHFNSFIYKTYLLRNITCKGSYL